MAISKLKDSARPHWQLHFWPMLTFFFFFFDKNAAFLFPGVKFYLDWLSSGLTVFTTLECCYLRAKFIVTAPWRISSMNLQSRLIVNLGCVWIGSLASVTVKRKLEVSVIGFLVWLLIVQEMHWSLWLAARIVISLCWCFELITFFFGVWLPVLTFSIEDKIGPLFKPSI